MYNTGFLLSVSFAVSRYSSLLTACTWHPLTKTEQKYISAANSNANRWRQLTHSATVHVTYEIEVPLTLCNTMQVSNWNCLSVVAQSGQQLGSGRTPRVCCTSSPLKNLHQDQKGSWSSPQHPSHRCSCSGHCQASWWMSPGSCYRCRHWHLQRNRSQTHWAHGKAVCWRTLAQRLWSSAMFALRKGSCWWGSSGVLGTGCSRSWWACMRIRLEMDCSPCCAADLASRHVCWWTGLQVQVVQFAARSSPEQTLKLALTGTQRTSLPQLHLAVAPRCSTALVAPWSWSSWKSYKWSRSPVCGTKGKKTFRKLDKIFESSSFELHNMNS